MIAVHEGERPTATRTDRLLADVDGYVVRVWDEVERFMRRHAVKPTTFGRLAGGDPNLVGRGRRGRRRLTLPMAARLKRFIDERPTGIPPSEAPPTAQPRPAPEPVPGMEIRR